jgi:hypothetical protein
VRRPRVKGPRERADDSQFTRGFAPFGTLKRYR